MLCGLVPANDRLQVLALGGASILMVSMDSHHCCMLCSAAIHRDAQADCVSS